MRIKTRQLPGRIAAGAFILNSGLSKGKADEQTANGCTGWRWGPGTPSSIGHGG